MNPDTGEIVQRLYGESFPEGFKELPENLQEEAFNLQQQVTKRPIIVPLDGDGPLSQYRRDLLAQKAKQKTSRRRKNKAARSARKRSRK